MNLKLSDFGLATEQKPDEMLTTFGGTEVYAAPEIHEKVAYDGYKSDIFSLGVSLLVIAYWKFPFTKATTTNKLFSLLFEFKYDAYWSKIDKNSIFSPEFKNLLE